MTTYTNPPPPLQLAINNASQTYGVPEDVLAGIWRVESGSSYPNPFVNSLGYGGLFGTKNAYGSTQSQANTAASILARLIRNDSGDLSHALSQYSGGGYTTVPGETTFGTVSPAGTMGGVPVAPQSTSSDTGGSGTGSKPGCPWQCLVPGLSATKDCSHCGAGNLPGGDLNPLNALADVFSSAFTWLQARLFRLGLILGGAILVILGVTLLAREGVPA